VCQYIRSVHYVFKLHQPYKPAAICVLNTNQTTKENEKITHCSCLKDFCSFNKNQSKFNSNTEGYAVYYFIIDYSISVVGFNNCLGTF